MYRQDRLGVLVEALLTNEYAARLIFFTHRKPTFYRQRQVAALSIFEVGGLKGKELYEIFDAYHASEVARDRMGPLHNHSGGHPMVARAFAVAWRDARDDDQRDAMWDAKRMPRLGRIDRTDPLSRYLQKRLDKVKGDLRTALASAAHLNVPANGRALAELGIRREHRIQLQRMGLLEVLPFGEERKYYVHALVARQLRLREISDFNTMETRGNYLMEQAETAEGVHKLALQQEANRLFAGCRRLGSRVRLESPDYDGILEGLRGMIRSEKNPNYGLAEQRLGQFMSPRQGQHRRVAAQGGADEPPARPRRRAGQALRRGPRGRPRSPRSTTTRPPTT